MTHKRTVKEHLRNGSLYLSPAASSVSEEWKHRLFYRHSMHGQLQTALQETKHWYRWLLYIGIPLICVVLVVGAFFGFIHPGDWLENVVRVLEFDIPSIGLKEIFILAAFVNGLTFSIRKRLFALL